LFILFAITLPALAQSKAMRSHGPDCSGGWPTDMTFAHIKNARITTNDKINFSKTKTVRLASEQIGDDLYRQVYYVKFMETSGNTIEAIAVHDASGEECSMTGVEVFVINKHLNPERK
jgi:hypothetical protein